MWSENSDEDIYITQSTFRQESNLDDVNDWFQDGSPTDGQVLNNNVEKEKATAKNRFGGTNAFYRSALKCPRSTCWYSNVPVGHNKLASTVKRLCGQAEISGYRTNHSLRATAATRMYDMGIDEQLICEKTGEQTEVIER